MSTRTTITPLRQRRIDDLTIGNRSPARPQSNVQRPCRDGFGRRLRPFARSARPRRCPNQQVHLASQGVAWASLNQIVCALRFCSGVTLGQAEVPERIAYARQPQTLPEVLSPDEVVRFLEAVPNLTRRTALTTAYPAGLRVLATFLVCPQRRCS